VKSRSAPAIGANAVDMIALLEMRLMLDESWVLDELAADRAQDIIYEFMMVAQPPLIPGAVRLPVAPPAIK
jgi:hypothetical protein